MFFHFGGEIDRLPPLVAGLT